jgi:DNA adenine methylase
MTTPPTQERGRALTQPIKRHGGKAYLAEWIISQMPPRAVNPNAPADSDRGWVHYVEPYFGGGSVLLAQDPEGISEVVNDLDGELTNFWRVLQSVELFGEFKRFIETMPCSSVEFEYAKRTLQAVRHQPVGEKPNANRAGCFFIVCRQSRQALGRDFATIARNRTRRGMNELPSAWLSSIEGLPDVHARMRRVVVLNAHAPKVIKQQDGNRTLYYVDPPYLHETRSTTGEYEHEMTRSQHVELLETLAKINGRFILSGYPSTLYTEYADRYGWHYESKQIDNKASGAEIKELKTECLWMNFTPPTFSHPEGGAL